jgi:hypothetical protein
VSAKWDVQWQVVDSIHARGSIGLFDAIGVADVVVYDYPLLSAEPLTIMNEDWHGSDPIGHTL